MANFSRYFEQGVKNTLLVKNGVNFFHKGPWIQIYGETEIDRWHVGDFSSASYLITVEYNSNKKETLQVLVVARPDQANYIVYGRVAIDDEIINISATVNNSYLSLKISPKIDDYSGAKLLFKASYSGTIADLSVASPLTYLVPDDSGSGGSGSGGSSGGGSSEIDLSAIAQSIIPSTNSTYDLGTNVKRWEDLYIDGVIDLGGVVIGKDITGNAIDLPAGTTINGTEITGFNKVSVSGQSDIVADSAGDRLTFVAGSGISISTNPTTDAITFTSTGGGSSSGGTTSSNNFATIAVSGQSNVVADKPNDILTLVAGTNITLTTNSASDTITISSTATGSSSGGGTATKVIIPEITSGSYPLVVSQGVDTLTGQFLYAKSSVTLDTATDTLTVTATAAKWADLAENYLADNHYDPGTVLAFGGDYEVTVAADETNKVAGVVTTNPAYLMNSELTGSFVAAIALQGRVPCKVRGNICKGDMLVSGGDGFARPTTSPKIGTIIGKALEDFNGVEGVIEVAVGRL
jgi:hypothetical protein